MSERAALSPQGELDCLHSCGVTLLTIADAEYPTLLRPVDGAPAVLHLRGTLLPEDELALAIVGNRQVTAYGRQVTLQMVGELSTHGITIVSGLAQA